MPLADWTIQRTDAETYVRIFNGAPRDGPMGLFDPVPTDVPALAAPLVGTGSVLFHAFARAKQAHWSRTAPGEHGFLLGRLRALAYVPVLGGGVMAFGLYCLANQESLVASSGAAGMVSLNTYLNQRRVELGPTATGLSGGWNMSGADLEAPAWQTDVQLALELAWQSDGETMQLQYRQGTLADFSDLGAALTYSGPATGGLLPVSEGLWAVTDTTDGCKVYFDQTILYPPWTL